MPSHVFPNDSIASHNGRTLTVNHNYLCVSHQAPCGGPNWEASILAAWPREVYWVSFLRTVAFL